MGIAAVSFKDKNGIEIIIYPQGEWEAIDFHMATYNKEICMTTYETKQGKSQSVLSKIDISTSVDNSTILRLRETATYTCKIC